MRAQGRSRHLQTREGWQARLMPYNEDGWRTETELVDHLRDRDAVSVHAQVNRFDPDSFEEPASPAILPDDAPTLADAVGF